MVATKLAGKRQVYVFILLGSIFMSLVLVFSLKSSRIIPAFVSLLPYKNVHYESKSVLGTSGCSEVEESQIYDWDQRNPCLAEYVRKHHLLPPSDQNYNFTHPGASHENEYTKFVAGLFPNKVSYPVNLLGQLY